MTAPTVEQLFLRDQKRINKLLPQISPITAKFLSADLTQLWNSYRQKLKNIKADRIREYRVIPCFLSYQLKQGRTTDITAIVTDDIDNFLKRERWHKIVVDEDSRHKNENWCRDILELKHFFDRACEGGVIKYNPAEPLYHPPPQKIEPRYWTVQNTIDYRTFEEYLDECISAGQLSPLTKQLYMRSLRVFLHDIIEQHELDPTWPVELDDLLDDPKWCAWWIRQLKNRSISGTFDLTEATVQQKYTFIIFLFRFHRLKGRCRNQRFLEDLARKFENHLGKRILPGRKSKVVGSLPEKDVERVFDIIAKDKDETLRLRNRAIILTALTNGMRVRSLSDMCIENMKRRKDSWECYTSIKRNSQQRNRQNLEDDGFEWGDWYVAPIAYKVIDEYLLKTERNWQSKGAIWLTQQGDPIDEDSMASIIRNLLEKAYCKFPGPHSLRHTAASRLLNVHRLPPTLVQQITRHKSLTVLLKIYGECELEDAYRAVNSIYDVTEGESNVSIVLNKIMRKLLELSAKIGDRIDKKLVLNVEIVAQVLRGVHQIEQELETCLELNGEKSRGRPAKPL